MIESSLYQAMRDGAHTPKQIAKKAKLSEEEVEEGLADFRGRGWLAINDDDPDSDKVSLSQVGQSELAGRYPD